MINLLRKQHNLEQWQSDDNILLLYDKYKKMTRKLCGRTVILKVVAKSKKKVKKLLEDFVLQLEEYYIKQGQTVNFCPDWKPTTENNPRL